MNNTAKFIESAIEKMDNDLIRELNQKENVMRNANIEYQHFRAKVIREAINLEAAVSENSHALPKDALEKFNELYRYAKRLEAEDKTSPVEKLLTHKLEYDDINLLNWLALNLGKDQYRTVKILLREAIEAGGPGKSAFL